MAGRMRRLLAWRPRYSLRSLVVFLLLATSATALHYRWKPWAKALVIEEPARTQAFAALSPDGRLIFCGGSPPFWIIRDARTGRVLLSVDGPKGAANFGGLRGRFSPGGRFITVWQAVEPPPTVYDTVRGEKLFELTDSGKGRLDTFEFSPDGGRIAASGRGHCPVIVFDCEGTREALRLSGTFCDVRDIGFSPDGTRIVTAGGWSAEVWDSSTGERLLELTGHGGLVVSVRYTSDGRRIMTSSRDGTTRIWDAETGRQLFLIGRRDMALSSDGRLAASIGPRPRRALEIWETESWSLLREMPIEPPFAEDIDFPGLDFLPGGERLLLGTWLDENADRVIDASSGRELATLEGTWTGAFPDGRRVLSCFAGKLQTVAVWERRRPEYRWGVLVLPDLWLTIVFAAALVWSLAADRHAFAARRVAP